MSALVTSKWERWVRRPQQLWFRRALFQAHLWIALALGAYIVMISVTGSAIVLRPQYNVWLVPRAVPSTAGVRMTRDEIEAAALRAYPNGKVTDITELRRLERPVFVTVERDGEVLDRLFDPYTGVDMANANPRVLGFVEWLVDLHDNLLAGDTGRVVNGFAGLLITLLVVSGAVIWWPGKRNWRKSMVVGKPAMTRRFAWQLHSSLGFWSLALMLVWAITAVYFAWPQPVENLIDDFDDNTNDQHRPGEWLLLLLLNLHFGRFANVYWRFVWVVLGLLPTVLFVSGFIMWWTRVVRRRRTVLDESVALDLETAESVPGAQR